jgi:hypothetical protein
MPTQIPSAPQKLGSEVLKTVYPFAWWLAGGFAIVSLVLRFADLPENFATFGALAFFCGLFLTGPGRWWVPAAVLFVADCIGHFLNVPGMGFYHVPSMVFNYIGFALFASVGAGLSAWWNRTAASPATALASLPVGATTGSLLFFLVSNFGAWLDPLMGYEKSASGLLQCYLMGLPFYRATLASDFFFGIGFAVIAWSLSRWLASRSRQVTV